MSKKVLVIEPNSNTQFFIEVWLQQVYGLVATIVDGPTNIPVNEEFVLVVTEFFPGKMDFLESFTRTPVIIFTVMDDRDHADISKEAEKGNVTYLRKTTIPSMTRLDGPIEKCLQPC